MKVDRETGVVRVLRFAAAHDSGKIVNRIGADGQVYGGVMMGLGQALTEGTQIDADGRQRNPHLLDYKLMTVSDGPQIDIHWVEIDTPNAGPKGSKGVGEPPSVPTSGAVGNAIAQRHRQARQPPADDARARLGDAPRRHGRDEWHLRRRDQRRGGRQGARRRRPPRRRRHRPRGRRPAGQEAAARRARRASTASTRCAASPPPAAGLRLGALVTHEEIESHAVVRERFTGLADASAIVGSHATRANGTIGGNVMNASPAMDTGAPLICLGATVVLQGPGGTRSVAIDELFTGPGKTIASPGRAADRRRPAGARRRHRLGLRAARVPPADGDRDRRRRRRGHDRGRQGDGGTRRHHGARADHPPGRRAAEQALVGSDGGRAAATRRGRRGSRTAAAPISDVRGSADYRRAMAAVIARRAIEAAIARAGGADVGIPASSSTYGAV